MDDESTLPCLIFETFGASYKGGRTYIHGSDIVDEIESFFSIQNGYIQNISFIKELKSPGRVVFTKNNDKKLSEGCAFGTLCLDGDKYYFRIEETGRALQPERSYNEDAISVFSKNGNNFRVAIGDRSAMEHILRGVKFASMQINPDVSKWSFAEMVEKTMPVPNIRSVSRIELRLKRSIAGRMLAFSVELDHKALATIKFIGK